MTSDAEAPAEPVTRAQRRRQSGRRGGWVFLRDVLVIILIAVVVSALVKTFLVRSFYIPSGSMEDTLQIDDRILVDELTPRWNGYQRGDIVVFQDPGGWLPPSVRPAQSPFVEGIDWLLTLVGLSVSDSEDHLIKRVIGVPGDHVVCCNALGQITINGVPIDESAYVKLDPGQTAPNPVPFDVVVPDGSLWVLGDNRDHSKDSRFNQDQPGAGFVPMENVVGRAFVTTWPISRWGILDPHSEVFAGVPAGEGTGAQ
jgi:signal peptidase I